MIKIILVQGFCPQNFRITQFTNGFCLKWLKYVFYNIYIESFCILQGNTCT